MFGAAVQYSKNLLGLIPLRTWEEKKYRYQQQINFFNWVALLSLIATAFLTVIYSYRDKKFSLPTIAAVSTQASKALAGRIQLWMKLEEYRLEHDKQLIVSRFIVSNQITDYTRNHHGFIGFIYESLAPFVVLASLFHITFFLILSPAMLYGISDCIEGYDDANALYQNHTRTDFDLKWKENNNHFLAGILIFANIACLFYLTLCLIGHKKYGGNPERSPLLFQRLSSVNSIFICATTVFGLFSYFYFASICHDFKDQSIELSIPNSFINSTIGLYALSCLTFVLGSKGHLHRVNNLALALTITGISATYLASLNLKFSAYHIAATSSIATLSTTLGFIIRGQVIKYVDHCIASDSEEDTPIYLRLFPILKHCCPAQATMERRLRQGPTRHRAARTYYALKDEGKASAVARTVTNREDRTVLPFHNASLKVGLAGEGVEERKLSADERAAQAGASAV